MTSGLTLFMERERLSPTAEQIDALSDSHWMEINISRDAPGNLDSHQHIGALALELKKASFHWLACALARHLRGDVTIEQALGLKATESGRPKSKATALRDVAVLEAFENGSSVQQIVRKFDMDYSDVRGLCKGSSKKDITERRTRAQRTIELKGYVSYFGAET